MFDDVHLGFSYSEGSIGFEEGSPDLFDALSSQPADLDHITQEMNHKVVKSQLTTVY